MNYQVQFLIKDEDTGVTYESPHKLFYHDQDVITLKWKGLSTIITGETRQSFHIYLEPYFLTNLVLQTGRVHWFSCFNFAKIMSNESTKVVLLTKKGDFPYTIRQVKISLFMNHIKTHFHKVFCIMEVIRPWRQSLAIGRAQTVIEHLDQKRVYTWLSESEQVPFPGIRMVNVQADTSLLQSLAPLLSPKKHTEVYMPDNSQFQNDIKALPITLDEESVVEVKFFNQNVFLFETILKQNLFSKENTTLCFYCTPLVMLEMDYVWNKKGNVCLIQMRLIVENFKTALNKEFDNKSGLTI